MTKWKKIALKPQDKKKKCARQSTELCLLIKLKNIMNTIPKPACFPQMKLLSASFLRGNYFFLEIFLCTLVFNSLSFFSPHSIDMWVVWLSSGSPHVNCCKRHEDEAEKSCWLNMYPWRTSHTHQKLKEFSHFLFSTREVECLCGWGLKGNKKNS